MSDSRERHRSGSRRPMRFAYADPPYLGKAEYYKAHHDDAMLWDDPATHQNLIDRLVDEYPDGWVMSLHESSLRVILPMCPQHARVGAWIAERPRFGGALSVQRHFEPVIWMGGRTWKDTGSRTADYCITKQQPLPPGEPRYRLTREKIRLGEIFVGRKPRAFAIWVFDLLGAGKGDILDDLFPGSGAIRAAWAERVGGDPQLPLTPLESAVGAK